MTQGTDSKARFNPVIFARVEPEERSTAQAIADEQYEGNLSMLVRAAVREYIKEWRKRRKTEGKAA